MELNGIQDPVVPSTVIQQSSRTPSQENGVAPLNEKSSLSSGEQAKEATQDNAPREPIASLRVQQEFPPNTRLHLDEATNRIVAQVLDENNQVVRQIPSEELLDISARFNRLEGILFNEQR